MCQVWMGEETSTVVGLGERDDMAPFALNVVFDWGDTFSGKSNVGSGPNSFQINMLENLHTPSKLIPFI